MKAKYRSRFDIDALRSRAGEKVFARGEAYHSSGHVQILMLERRRVLALVAGTDDYRTELTGSGKSIEGDCSCPAYEDWGLCKHMVAVAIAANAAGADGDADGVGVLARIRGHLKEKGIDALVEMIVDIAERDPALFRKLDVAALTVDGNDETLKARMRKAIDDATRTRGFVDYREASGWADGVDAALDTLAGLASGPRAGLALELAERAIDRIEGAIESIDDSDGHCGRLLERARDIHLAAARVARPDPVALAQALFVREVEGDSDAFHGAAALYADVLGDEGSAEYRRLATEAWEKLPARVGGARRDDSGDYGALKDILDGFAERDGDVEARIALRAKDLSSAWSYLWLAEFCRSQDRAAEALWYAEEGVWMFEDDRPEERLVLLAVELLVEAGRKADGVAHLWRAFEKAPSEELYAQLRKLAGKPARGRALKMLEARAAREEGSIWYHPADLLVRILMKERMLDAAWAMVRAHGASRDVKESLARMSEATHAGEALEVYAERVEELADAGGNPAYAEAVALIARMAALRGAGEQAAYVASVKERFGRKRNFMKLLG